MVSPDEVLSGPGVVERNREALERVDPGKPVILKYVDGSVVIGVATRRGNRWWVTDRHMKVHEVRLDQVTDVFQDSKANPVLRKKEVDER